MIAAVPQEWRVPVQQSGTNTPINLPAEMRRLFGIEKGDILVLRYDPASKTPLIVVDIEKPQQGDKPSPC